MKSKKKGLNNRIFYFKRRSLFYRSPVLWYTFFFFWPNFEVIRSNRLKTRFSTVTRRKQLTMIWNTRDTKAMGYNGYIDYPCYKTSSIFVLIQFGLYNPNMIFPWFFWQRRLYRWCWDIIIWNKKYFRFYNPN